ncbi:hypothetical protein, partial [Photorhabdus bodei]|uniref:hypothetical protein n=1 Tax=Photorhabdus bodei TaxID=2029681 RepID=UPI00142E1B5E
AQVEGRRQCILGFNAQVLIDPLINGELTQLFLGIDERQFVGRKAADRPPQTLFSLYLFSILQKNRIENNACLFIFFYTARHNSFFEYRQYGF